MPYPRDFAQRPSHLNQHSSKLKHVLILGLTGGIGAGKSTVSAELARLGAEVIDADKIAREVVAPGTPGLDMLAAEFGEEIIDADGALDRAALAERAFASQERTAALNSITHPLIGERTVERFAQAPQDAIVVHDVPLLIEGGMEPGYHLVLVVDTPEELRLQRLVELRGLTEADARGRIAKQATDEQRHASADILFDNSGSESALLEQVRKVWDQRLVVMANNLEHRHPVFPSDTVVDVRPEWADEARREIARIRHRVGDLCESISHVGPTAQEQPAVDLIEIELRPNSVDVVETLRARLQDAGYIADDAGEGKLRWVDPERPVALRIPSTDQTDMTVAAACADRES